MNSRHYQPTKIGIEPATGTRDESNRPKKSYAQILGSKDHLLATERAGPMTQNKVGYKVAQSTNKVKGPTKIEIVGELGSGEGRLNAPSSILARLGSSQTPVSLLLDTGATIELIKKTAVPQEFLKNIRKASVQITGVNRGTLPNLGVVRIPVHFHSKGSILTDFVVIADSEAGFTSQALIGRNYLRSNHIYFTNENKAVTFKGINIPLVNHDNFINNKQSADRKKETRNNQNACIFASRQTVLPPRTSAVVQGFIRGKTEETNLLLLPEQKENIYVAESVHHLENDKRTFVHVTNLSSHPAIINKSSKLGELVPFFSDSIDKIFPQESNCFISNQTEKPRIGDIPAEIENKLQQLIAEYDDIFAKENSYLKPTNIGKASVLTEGGPIFTRGFPIAEKLKEPLDKEIKRLLELGVIRKSKGSEWNSPFLLVKKVDPTTKITKFRGVLDFRNINKITRPIHYESPNIERLLEKLGGNSWYSITDLKLAFLQVELTDPSVTSFRIGNQCFEYTRMAMGLRNSSAQFQEIIDTAINRYSLKPERRSAYCDDLLTYSPESAPEVHLHDIRETFQILRQASLSISLDKCQFFKKEIKFLGFIVSQDRVEPDPEKCRILADLPRPETAKMLTSFLASANFFRRHIPQFSNTTAPLYNLANKKSKKDFIWTDETEKAFQAIKKALVNATKLGYPDLSKKARPFILYTDASLHAISGVLTQSQEIDGEWTNVPIGFCSRLLSETEKRKSIYNLELQAIVYGIKKFSHLLTYNHFILRCDHKPLTFLLTTQKLNPALSRIVDFLSEFSFTIEYCIGAENISDIFSRIDVSSGKIKYTPESQTNEKSATFEQFLEEWENFRQDTARKKNNVKGKTNHKILATTAIDPKRTLWNKLNPFPKSELLKKQKLMPLYEQVKTNPSRFNNYIFSQDGLLYRALKNKYLLLIPPPLEQEIFKAFHENPQSFHHGVTRTWQSMKNLVYFPNMKKFIESNIANCEICQKSKSSRHQPKPAMKIFPIPQEPWNHLHFDTAGPIFSPGITCKHKYALLITDRFSKYTVIKELERNDSESIFDALLSVFLEYGFPVTVTCDQASPHTSPKFIDALKNFNVKVTFSQAYQANQNGLVERQISTCKASLRAMLSEFPTFKWTDTTKFVQSAMNAAISRPTNRSPNEVFFGRHVKTANDANFAFIPTYFETDDNFQSRLALLKNLRNETKLRLEKYSKEMVERYNQNLKPAVNIPVGAKVYRINNNPHDPRKGPLYVNKYDGPFIVKSTKGNNVELVDPRTRNIKTSHVSQLKWPRQATVSSSDKNDSRFEAHGNNDELVSRPGPSHSYNLRNKQINKQT